MVETNVMESAYAPQSQSFLSSNLQNQKFGTTLSSDQSLLSQQQQQPLLSQQQPLLSQQQQPLLSQQQQQPLLSQQQPLLGQQQRGSFIEQSQFSTERTVLRDEQFSSSNIIQEKPVLDRVEKLLRKEVIQKPMIQEQLRQDIIEIHERPIEKRFLHPVQEIFIQDQGTFEVQGREVAEMERNRVLSQMREQDRLRQVQVDQRQDVRVINEPPLSSQTREMRKEIIQKPIVTEIHEQPVREIHEQVIQRTVYQKPVINVIREEKFIENITSQSALVYDANQFRGTSGTIPSQSFIGQQQFGTQYAGYTPTSGPLLGQQAGYGSSSFGGQQQGSFLSGQQRGSFLPSQQQQGSFLPSQQQGSFLPSQQQGFTQGSSQYGYGGTGNLQQSSFLPTQQQGSFLPSQQQGSFLPSQQQSSFLPSQQQGAFPTQQQGFMPTQQTQGLTGSGLMQQGSQQLLGGSTSAQGLTGGSTFAQPYSSKVASMI